MQPPSLHPSNPQRHHEQRWLRRLAWLCAALVLAITCLSAFVRLVHSGVGCTPWPACYGQLSAPAAGSALAGASEGAVATARVAHRVAASSSLAVILLLLALTLKWRQRSQARHAAGLLMLALFLAVLGVATRSSLLPAVTLGNLLAGFGMLVLSVRLACLHPSSGAARSPLTTWAWTALALVFLQAALGALVSSGHAGLSCPAWGLCDLSQASWRSLNPWLAPAADASPSHAGGALVHLLHRAAGLALLGFLAVMAWRAARLAHPGVAAAVLALPALQVMLGFGLVAQRLPLAATWTHNLLAALLLALLASLTTLRQAPPARHPT